MNTVIKYIFSVTLLVCIITLPIAKAQSPSSNSSESSPPTPTPPLPSATTPLSTSNVPQQQLQSSSSPSLSSSSSSSSSLSTPLIMNDWSSFSSFSNNGIVLPANTIQQQQQSSSFPIVYGASSSGSPQMSSNVINDNKNVVIVDSLNDNVNNNNNCMNNPNLCQTPSSSSSVLSKNTVMVTQVVEDLKLNNTGKDKKALKEEKNTESNIDQVQKRLSSVEKQLKDKQFKQAATDAQSILKSLDDIDAKIFKYETKDRARMNSGKDVDFVLKKLATDHDKVQVLRTQANNIAEDAQKEQSFQFSCAHPSCPPNKPVCPHAACPPPESQTMCYHPQCPSSMPFCPHPACASTEDVQLNGDMKSELKNLEDEEKKFGKRLAEFRKEQNELNSQLIANNNKSSKKEKKNQMLNGLKKLKNKVSRDVKALQAMQDDASAEYAARIETLAAEFTSLKISLKRMIKKLDKKKQSKKKGFGKIDKLIHEAERLAKMVAKEEDEEKSTLKSPTSIIDKNTKTKIQQDTPKEIDKASKDIEAADQMLVDSYVKGKITTEQMNQKQSQIQELKSVVTTEAQAMDKLFAKLDDKLTTNSTSKNQDVQQVAAKVEQIETKEVQDSQRINKYAGKFKALSTRVTVLEDALKAVQTEMNQFKKK